MRWKKPRRIFVNSMSDLFHEGFSILDVEHVFRVMLSAPRHTYQILTKRADIMAFRVPIIMNRIYGPHWSMPDFIWLGVSVENQEYANKRIPLLLRTPAAKRFVSYEPALGPVDFDSSLGGTRWIGGQRGCGQLDKRGVHHHDDRCSSGIDWIIVGGESGPGARPFDIQWARNTVRQCREAGVAAFVKQMGAHVIQGGERRKKADKKGGNMHEWPHDLRVREFPATEPSQPADSSVPRAG
jgi:protein gp37